MPLCILQGEAMQNRQIETNVLRTHLNKLFDSAHNQIDVMSCSFICHAVKLTFSLVQRFLFFILLTH